MSRNDRLIRALLREPVDVTPVWIMRQAGRYLPEYRAVREQAGDFLTLCKTPELACEVTLQPLRRFPLDAAILFSDILTIPDAMGLGLSVEEQVGPRFARPLRCASDINALHVPDPESELGYVMAAIRLTQRELAGQTPLIGFSGSPWTLATYMVEGGTSKNFAKIKSMLYGNPALLHQLLDILSTAVSAYLNAQISAGVDVVMIFDTWGGALSSHDFERFSLDYIKDVVQKLQTGTGEARVPVIVFTKGGGQWLEAIADTGCDALGLDWTTDIRDARRRVGAKVALQGNMDPAVLLSTPARIEQAVAYILGRYGRGSGHVFNLGHGITPDVDPENARALVEAVHELSQAYH